MTQNLDKLTRKVALYLKNKDAYISIEALAKKMNLSPSTITSVVESNSELFETESELLNPHTQGDLFYDFRTNIARVKLSPKGQAYIANDRLNNRFAFRSIFVYPIVVKMEWAMIGFLIGIFTGHIDFFLNVIKKVFEK